MRRSRDRDRTQCGWLLLLIGGVATQLGCSELEPPDRGHGRPPDVILVMIDTLRTDHMSLFGYPKPTTPEIEEFAGVATDYRRAYAQSSWTAPSVASLLASRYPRELGEHKAPSKLHPDTRTLARVLGDHGYQTEAVFTNRYISTRYGHEIGYDRVQEHLSHGAMVTSQQVTDAALLAARESDRDRPLFLYAHYFDPHYDYVLQPGFELGPKAWGHPYDRNVVSFLAQTLRADLDEEAMRGSRRNYDSEIAYTDHHVGRLLSGLRALGRFEHAVVVVVADHGEEFLDHGEIGHAIALYNETVHVPLLIKRPGQTHGERHLEPVSLLDVAPTIVALAGLPREASHRGKSLDGSRAPSPVFTSTFYYSEDEIAVIAGRYKAIIDYRLGTFELFDLLVDPREQHSIADRKPRVAALLRARVESWNEGRFQLKRGHDVRLTDREKAIMRSLGYAE